MTQAVRISPAWVAVDWGTSNLRAYAIGPDGAVLAQLSSDKGMSSVPKGGFEAALLDLLDPWDLPAPCTIMACGMVGSRQGWVEAPYRSVPCDIRHLVPVTAPSTSPRLTVHILPGIKQDTPADVMRGEETQIAGFLAQNDSWDGVICLPGTHSKWVHVSAGEVVSFRSFMTGELFETISTKTVLQHSVNTDTDAFDGDAFDAAIADTLSRPETLASHLFRLRAEDLLRGQTPQIARAKLSGLLIGAELAAAKPFWIGQRVALIGEGRLVDLYAAALNAQSVPTQRADGAEMTCAGLIAAYHSV